MPVTASSKLQDTPESKSSHGIVGSCKVRISADVREDSSDFQKGQDTDQAAISRLRNCIKSGKESVELILNYKENGEPFWNLLYCAPLFGLSGEIEFFIGGQINCSTTIHSNADIMSVLASSDKPSEPAPITPPHYTPSIKAPSSRNFFKTAFRSAHRQETVHVSTEAGAEVGMLRDLEGKSLPTQMQQFYSAYSKVSKIERHIDYIVSMANSK